MVELLHNLLRMSAAPKEREFAYATKLILLDGGSFEGVGVPYEEVINKDIRFIRQGAVP